MPDVFLRSGAMNPTDVTLYDPTQPDAPPASGTPPLRMMTGTGT